MTYTFMPKATHLHQCHSRVGGIRYEQRFNQKLEAELKEYKDKTNRLDHFLHTDDAEALDDYDLGLLQYQRKELIRLTVIVELRLRSLKG